VSADVVVIAPSVSSSPNNSEVAEEAAAVSPIEMSSELSEDTLSVDGDQESSNVAEDQAEEPPAPFVPAQPVFEEGMENWFACHHCGKALPTKSRLIVHIRTHTNERPYQCLWCEWAFRQLGHLKAHSIRKHPQEDLSLLTVKNTMKKPIQQMDFQTIGASLSASNSEDINSSSVASGSGDEDCIDEIGFRDSLESSDSPNAEKSLTPPSASKKRSHDQISSSNSKDEVVEISEAKLMLSFTPDNLRPHQCELCLYCFKSTKAYLEHRPTHRATSMLECYYCFRLCETRVEMLEHIKTHAGPQLFYCNICPRTFKKKSGLSTHLVRSHPKKPRVESPSPLLDLANVSSPLLQLVTLDSLPIIKE